jgi:hypothetical protein
MAAVANLVVPRSHRPLAVSMAQLVVVLAMVVASPQEQEAAEMAPHGSPILTRVTIWCIMFNIIIYFINIFFYK